MRTQINMHLFLFSLSAVAFFHSSVPLSRDFASNIENLHYKFGYRWTSHLRPGIASAFSVQNLARTEREIYKEIRKLLNHNSSSVNAHQVGQFVKDYEDSALVLAESFESEEFIRAVAGNLVSVYRMIRRFRNFIQVWLLPSRAQSRGIGDAIINTLKSIYNVHKGPHRIDFHISMLAFALLQFNYDIKAEQIAAGIYSGRVTGVQMEAIHCLEIGLHSVASGYYPIGIEWIEHALEKVNRGDVTVDERLVKLYLEKAIARHDADWQPFNEKDMVRVFYQKPLNQTTDVSQRKWRKTGNFTRDHESFPHEDYGGVCQGDIKQVKFCILKLPRWLEFRDFSKSETETSKLFCWFESSIHPIWKIGPLKSELLTPLPDQIVQFHDVITDDLTQEIRKAADGRFVVSMLTKFMKIHPRIQYSGDMTEIPNSIKLKLENLASRLSGLQVQNDSAARYEPFELTSYVPGGFTTLHVDWASGGITSERLATLIIYLDGPEIGGSTGFPRLKMAAPAIRGSAILWFNVNSAGAQASKTIHGSCPVAIGSKWIALKWIPYVQQNHLKCDVNKNAGMDYLSNARSALLQ